MLLFLSIAVLVAVAYAYSAEGLFTGALMCSNVFLSGLIAFNFWEPLASSIEGSLADTWLAGYEDMFALVGLFALSLGALRTASNAVVNTQISFPPGVQQAGGAIFGLLTGYLFSGFFICALQTLPWHENFLGFDPTYQSASSAGLRQYLPADRVWLAMMYRAGAFAFNRGVEDLRFANSPSYYDQFYTFDKYGSFELRYTRYRRYGTNRDPMIYSGEFAAELAGPGPTQ